MGEGGRHEGGVGCGLSQIGVGTTDEVGCHLSQIGVGTTDEIGEESRVIEHHGHLIEINGKDLDAHAIVINGNIILTESGKLALQEDSTLDFVAKKQRAEASPDAVGRRFIGVVHVEEPFRDGELEPLDDGGMDEGPPHIGLHGVSIESAVDAIVEAVRGEEEAKVGAPCGVCWRFKVEHDMHVLLDVVIVIDGDKGVRGAHGG